MRFISFRRSAHAWFSFAGAGIARRYGRMMSHAAHQRRRSRASFSAWRLHSEPLEGRAMMAGFDFINGVAVPAGSPVQDAGSRATPVSSVVVDLANASTTLDDFELFYSPGGGAAGSVIDLTPPLLPTPPITVPTIAPLGGTKYQIDFLSDYTKGAGTYIFRLANPAVDTGFEVKWVMTTPTPGELGAT
jgi:hypothetical protein